MGAYQKSGQDKDFFFDKWLKVLFFQVFNNKFDSGYHYFPNDIKDALAEAPYLNDGLFKENGLDHKYSFTVSDEKFERAFRFFERYNFIIIEDSPLDREVAVDQKMIGKVYESLVNFSEEADERGDAGIFYTSRTEIDLMCRLALVDYLSNHLVEDKKSFLYEAVFALEPEEKMEADDKLEQANLWTSVNELLKNITVLDPACGSGSFLVGMLLVIYDLLTRANKVLRSDEPAYKRKKRIIARSLYGVDVMQ